MRLLLLYSSATAWLKEINKASFAILSVTDHSCEPAHALCAYKQPHTPLCLQTILNRELIIKNYNILHQRSYLQ